MSYQVLARKWRPQNFQDMVGQDHISETLINAIRTGRVGHAYLFVGTRGIGKTTSARIFAKALNCKNLREDGNPCDQCQNCLEIIAGSSLDVIEIDGASNNSVDDIRTIRDGVAYAPSNSPYKIYIIDEVHMLSTAAWNALLKTLEEPPSHVKFLFATTEAHKVLPTIISRCQRFDLKRIPQKTIADRLRQIVQDEGFAFDEAALQAIARSANGGMRDALSITDQMIAFCGSNDQPISEDDVTEVFGMTSNREIYGLIGALFADDVKALLAGVNSLADRGRNLEILFSDLLGALRNIMVVSVTGPDATVILQMDASAIEPMRAIATGAHPSVIQRLLDGMLEYDGRIRHTLNKRVALELILVRVMREAHAVQLDDVLKQLNYLRGTELQDLDSEGTSAQKKSLSDFPNPFDAPVESRPLDVPQSHTSAVVEEALSPEPQVVEALNNLTTVADSALEFPEAVVADLPAPDDAGEGFEGISVFEDSVPVESLPSDLVSELPKTVVEDVSVSSDLEGQYDATPVFEESVSAPIASTFAETAAPLTQAFEPQYDEASFVVEEQAPTPYDNVQAPLAEVVSEQEISAPLAESFPPVSENAEAPHTELLESFGAPLAQVFEAVEEPFELPPEESVPEFSGLPTDAPKVIEGDGAANDLTPEQLAVIEASEFSIPESAYSASEVQEVQAPVEPVRGFEVGEVPLDVDQTRQGPSSSVSRKTYCPVSSATKPEVSGFLLERDLLGMEGDLLQIGYEKERKFDTARLSEPTAVAGFDAAGARRQENSMSVAAKADLYHTEKSIELPASSGLASQESHMVQNSSFEPVQPECSSEFEQVDEVLNVVSADLPEDSIEVPEGELSSTIDGTNHDVLSPLAVELDTEEGLSASAISLAEAEVLPTAEAMNPPAIVDITPPAQAAIELPETFSTAGLEASLGKPPAATIAGPLKTIDEELREVPESYPASSIPEPEDDKDRLFNQLKSSVSAEFSVLLDELKVVSFAGTTLCLSYPIDMQGAERLKSGPLYDRLQQAYQSIVSGGTLMLLSAAAEKESGPALKSGSEIMQRVQESSFVQNVVSDFDGKIVDARGR